MHNSAWYKSSAQRALTGRYWLCVLVALVALLLGGEASTPTLRFSYNLAAEDWNRVWSMIRDTEFIRVLLRFLSAFGSVTSLYSLGVFIIGGAIEQGYDLFNIALFTGDAPDISMLFSRMSNLGRALWLRILIALRIFAWSLLLFVPGVVASFRYALAPFLMAEYPELTASEAIEKSKSIMQGKKWQLFCLYCSFIGWYLLAALTFGIGLVFLAPYVKAAETSFYLDVCGRMKVE